MSPRHTLLVVDDEADVVKSIHDLLRREYRILGATSAAEALVLMANEEVHMVMSDQRMPTMTGVDFLARVRQDFPDTVRLMFTGYADLDAVVEAINAGHVFRYITKPWEPDELRSIIQQAAERHDWLLERKQLLRELRTKNELLENANRELRAADELKTAFMQVASHELRTPLTILLGLSMLALRTPDLEPTLHDRLKRLHQASLRMQRLVENMLQLLVAGGFALKPTLQPTDLGELLQQAVDDVRPFVDLRHQNLTVDVSGDLTNVPLEADKIRDSVGHLLLNAIKFTPDHGRIAVTATREDAFVVLSIRDTGVGIQKDALAHLFEPFFTGFDVSRHSSGHYEFNRKGLGLGLSLIKRFVEHHGGTVSVNSIVGEGTTFVVKLPVNPFESNRKTANPDFPPSAKPLE